VAEAPLRTTKLVFKASTEEGKKVKKNKLASLLCLEALAARAMRFVSKKKSRHCFSCLAGLFDSAIARLAHPADTLDGAAVSLLHNRGFPTPRVISAICWLVRHFLLNDNRESSVPRKNKKLNHVWVLCVEGDSFSIGIYARMSTIKVRISNLKLLTFRF